MNAGRFISRKVGFKGNLATWATGTSFFIIIISIAISEGYRKEIRATLSDTYGDVVVMTSEKLPAIDSVQGVRSVQPVILRNGIIRSGLHIIGVQFRGTATCDSIPLQAGIPASLAGKTGFSAGDKLQAYFVGEKMQARNFTISYIYEDIADRSDASVIKVNIRDLQRLEGLGNDGFTTLEVTLDENLRERDDMASKAREISFRSGIIAQSLPDRFPQLFDWLDLIDANVMAILLLMSIVAGFNMISSLLIMLFRNVSTIGTLKALGMTNHGIAGVFLRAGSSVILKGMAIGNAAAMLFCLIQGSTRLIKLNPDNYFLPFVPVDVKIPSFLAADVLAYVVIMILLLLPTVFISKVDPAKTVRED